MLSMILGIFVAMFGFDLIVFSIMNGFKKCLIVAGIGLIFLIVGGSLFFYSDTDAMTYEQSSEEVILKTKIENTYKLEDGEMAYKIKFSYDDSSFTAEMSEAEYKELIGDGDSVKSEVYTLTCINENGYRTTLKRYSFLDEKDFSSGDKDNIKKTLNGDGTFDKKLKVLENFVKSKGSVIAG